MKNNTTPRTSASEHVPAPAERDTGLRGQLPAASQQTYNASFPSTHRREIQLRHPEPSTGRRKRVRRIILKPFKLLGSAVKHAVGCCFGSSTQEMDGGVFVREHIVDGKIVQSRNDRVAVEDRADGTGMDKEDKQGVCQHDTESLTSLEVGRQSSESGGDECVSCGSSDSTGEPSSEEFCREQSEVEGAASEDARPLEEEFEDRTLTGDEDKTCSDSSPALSTNGSDEEKQATRSGSVLSSQCVDEQLEHNESSCVDCELETALANTSAAEDRNDTELTLLGQTEAEFMEMVCSPIPFLDGEQSDELAEGEDSSATGQSCGEESFYDSDHSSMAGSYSGDEEWDEEVVVFSRASRLLSSGQRTVVARRCE